MAVPSSSSTAGCAAAHGRKRGELRARENELGLLLAEEDVEAIGAAIDPVSVAAVGVIDAPVARMAAVAGTAAVVTQGVHRRSDRRDDRPAMTGATAAGIVASADSIGATL